MTSKMWLMKRRKKFRQLENMERELYIQIIRLRNTITETKN